MASSKLSYVSTIRDDIPTSFTSKLSYTHLFSFLFLPPLFLLRYFSRRPLDLGILSRDDLSSSENFIIIIIIISSSSPFSSFSSSLEISSHRIIYFSLSLGNFSILVSIFRLILSVSTKRIVKIER